MAKVILEFNPDEDREDMVTATKIHMLSSMMV